MDVTNTTAIVILLVAVLAPIASRALGRLAPVPIVVFELVLGIVVGPSVLGWAHQNDFVDRLSAYGLAVLFFVAGSEIDVTALRGRTGRGAVVGWLLSLAAGVGLGWVFAPGEAAVVMGIAAASTALGTILPILRDAGELRTPFGRSVSAIGAVGEFGPLVAITVFLGGRNPGVETVVLGLFVLIAAGAIWLAFRLPRGRLHAVVNATLHTSGQFAIRVLLLILGTLLTISVLLDIDFLLGAFTAGVVWRLVMRDAAPADREAVESKVEAVAFGFLVPVFFIYTGVTFDLGALLGNPALFAWVAAALVLLFVVRGLPSMLAAPRGSSIRDRLAVSFFGATGLPIIVAVMAIGTRENIVPSSTASVFVGAGMLSVLLFPLIAMSVKGERGTAGSLPEDPDAG